MWTPPAGCARWTIALIVKETKRRGIVASIGDETIRTLLAAHNLKPWREKMWCVPKLDDEYIARMEDVLDTLAKPINPDEPVVALDERPVQLHGSARADTPMAPGRVKRRDYEFDMAPPTSSASSSRKPAVI